MGCKIGRPFEMAEHVSVPELHLPPEPAPEQPPRGRLGRGRGGFFTAGRVAALRRGFLTTPYRGMPIEGIRHNLAHNGLKAVALITLDYSTGQSVRWVQGRQADVFEGPNRRAE